MRIQENRLLSVVSNYSSFKARRSCFTFPSPAQSLLYIPSLLRYKLPHSLPASKKKASIIPATKPSKSFLNEYSFPFRVSRNVESRGPSQRKPQSGNNREKANNVSKSGFGARATSLSSQMYVLFLNRR